MKKTLTTLGTLATLLLVTSTMLVGNTPRIISPNGGESFRPGSTQQLVWDTATTVEGTVWKFQIGTSANGPWTDLVGTTKVKDSAKTRGNASWRVPTINSQHAFMRMVSVEDPLLFGISDGSFEVVAATPIHVDSTLRGTIEGVITLDNRKVYGLDGYVYVNGTIIINPGTIIVGDTVGQNSVLCINRGAKIIADGTPDQPIVFTSRAAPGQRSRGDWGGVVICGHARINTPGGEAQIEGGIADPTPGKGWYGGDNDEDNSGILRYVRIEFAGIAVLPDNELNGLTCGGVGSGTVIDYIQISHSNDDALECFGGTVNVKHIVTLGTLDDDFDSDNGYRGKMQFGLVKRYRLIADQSTSEAIESDNDSKASYNTPRTAPVYANLTIIGPMQDTSWTPGNGASNFNSRYGAAIQIRRASLASVYNSVVVGFPRGLEIAQAPTMASAFADSICVRACDWYGWKYSWLNLASGNPPSGMDKNWIQQESFLNNGVAGNPNAAQLASPWWEDISFNPTPLPSASYLSSAKWDIGREEHNLDDPFFTQVEYRGAFASDVTERWDLPWTNYDPVQADYTPVSVDEWQTAVVSGIDGSIFPNPASQNATVRFILNKATSVTVTLATMLGETMQTMIRNTTLNDGVYEITLDTSLLETGSYYITVATNLEQHTMPVQITR